MKKAFSLIEVIFVLVILGIVASISSQIIVQVYDNYLTQRALYTTTTKTEMAINQIVNRLTFAIEGTTISKDPLSPNSYTASTEESNWIDLNGIDISLPNYHRFTTIEWIGYDNDSFSAGAAPYWSGLANYNGATTTRSTVETPGSRLDLANNIIKNLSNGKVALDSTGTGTNGGLPAIIFTGENYLDSNISHDPACMGLVNENNTSCISRVSRLDNTHFTFPNGKEKTIYERYKLAWSAYALVPKEIMKNGVGTGLFDLNLWYNYQPWNGEKYTDGKHSLLIKNVSVFKFTENGGVIQLKLCASENIGQDFNISSCKEKAIIK